MTNAFKKLYTRMCQHADPAVWAVLFVAVFGTYHYHQRLYWETPSIPFQPFCNPINEFDPYRPIKGVTMTRAFAKEAVLAMAENGVTAWGDIPGTFDDFKSTPLAIPVLVSPKDFADDRLMIGVTRDAIAKYKNIDPDNIHINPEFLDTQKDDMIANSPGHFSLRCKDIEGVIKEF